ncbi:MAG: delta-60 repeat domain-containing protein [Rudaea sp.]|nr:delta-60 repeat domain-containing protein [Rudaea sp.]
MLLGATPTSGQAMERILALAVQGDGKIVVAGRVQNNTGSPLAAVGRLNTDGSWDTAFGDNGLFVLPYGVPSAPYGASLLTVGLMSDGSILASGGAYAGPGLFFPLDSCTLLLKLTGTGTLDTSFASDQSGSFCYDFASANNMYEAHYDGIAIDSDDTWYLTSPSTNLAYGEVAHFDASGALITSYGNSGIAALPYRVFGLQVQVQSDHPVLVDSVYTSSDGQGIAVSDVDLTGAINNQYGVVGSYAVDFQTNGYPQVESATLDGQGRLVVAENSFTGVDYLAYRFARATPAGIADASFNAMASNPDIRVLRSLSSRATPVQTILLRPRRSPTATFSPSAMPAR